MVTSRIPTGRGLRRELLKIYGPGQRLKEKTHRGIYAGSRASRSTPSHKASSGQLFECQKGNQQPVITQGSYTVVVSQENGTQVTQVEFDPENRGDPGRPRVFTRHGLWVCVAPFKSKEPESKRPRICLEEGRAATKRAPAATRAEKKRLYSSKTAPGPTVTHLRRRPWHVLKTYGCRLRP